MSGDGASSWAGGAEDEAGQAERLLPLVYDELRRIAASMLGGGNGRGGNGGPVTMQPTAVVHEAFVRLSAQDASRWRNEGHFRAVASIAMRRVLADYAKSRGRIKRGGGWERVGLTLGVDVVDAGVADPVDVHGALEELERVSPRIARLVVYRFFGDLSVEQAAERLGVSLSTAEADWRFARAWLKDRLKGRDG